MDKLTSFFLQKKLISPQLAPWLSYALKHILISAFSYSILIALGWLTAGMLPTVVFLLCFSLLRQYIGGWHASSPAVCLLLSCLLEIFFLFLLLPLLLYTPYIWSAALGVISFITIFALAPLIPKGLNETLQERMALKKLSRKFAALELAALLVFFVFQLPLISLYISLGMLCAAVTLWIEKINLRRIKV